MHHWDDVSSRYRSALVDHAWFIIPPATRTGRFTLPFTFSTIAYRISIFLRFIKICQYEDPYTHEAKATLGIPTCNKFAIHMIFTRTQCEQKYWHYSDLNALTMCSLWRLLVEMFMYAFVSYYRDLDTSKTKHETNQSLSLTLCLNKTVNFVVRTETVPLYK